MISHFKNCSVHSFLRFTNVWIFFLFLIKWEKYTMFKSACPLLPMGFAKWKNPLSDIRELVWLEDKGRNPLAHWVYTSPFGLTEQSPGLLAGWESFPVTFRIFWCKTENFSFTEPGTHFEYDVWQCEIENTFGAKDITLLKRSWILSLLVVSQSVSRGLKLQRQLLNV